MVWRGIGAGQRGGVASSSNGADPALAEFASFFCSVIFD
jgi:hypothetical protein